MNEVLQVTVEQLLLQKKLRDEDIRFLKMENAKILFELESSRMTVMALQAENKMLKWCCAQSNN